MLSSKLEDEFVGVEGQPPNQIHLKVAPKFRLAKENKLLR
jgi:hypothetical protein